MARPRVFEPGVEPTRSALLRSDRPFLDWPPIIQHVSRVLHRGVPAAPARAANPVCGAPASRNDRVFCAVSAGRLYVAMDARGATDWTGDYRLRLRDVPFRRATL